MIKHSIDKAANWWADHVGAEDTKQDNGDALQSGFASFVRRDGYFNLSDDEREVFRDALKLQLGLAWRKAVRLRRGWDPEYVAQYPVGITFGCDYGPDKILYVAMAPVLGETKARNLLYWPMKTYMRMEEDRVVVSYGYGAEWKEL